MAEEEERTGLTQETAIIIDIPDHTLGIQEEYDFIYRHFGQKGLDWNLVQQKLIVDQTDRQYDLIEIELANGHFVKLWFDITIPMKGLRESLGDLGKEKNDYPESILDKRCQEKEIDNVVKPAFYEVIASS